MQQLLLKTHRAKKSFLSLSGLSFRLLRGSPNILAIEWLSSQREVNTSLGLLFPSKVDNFPCCVFFLFLEGRCSYFWSPFAAIKGVPNADGNSRSLNSPGKLGLTYPVFGFHGLAALATWGFHHEKARFPSDFFKEAKS